MADGRGVSRGLARCEHRRERLWPLAETEPLAAEGGYVGSLHAIERRDGVPVPPDEPGVDARGVATSAQLPVGTDVPAPLPVLVERGAESGNCVEAPGQGLGGRVRSGRLQRV